MLSKLKLISYIFIFLFSMTLFAAVEVGFDYGYDRQLYGKTWQNKIISTSYSGHWAWYMFTTTALELNYTDSKNVHTQNASYVTDAGDQVDVSMQETVHSTVYGVGIRQMLVPQKSRITPLISIGYAKQFTKSSTDTNYTVNGSTATFHETDPARRSDNVFGAFILKIYITKSLAINGSVKTIFRAFEFNEAQYNLKYLAGFSWMF